MNRCVHKIGVVLTVCCCFCLQITIFKYIEDKDLFHKYYADFLAQRLIGNSSFSSDHERSVIAGLKVM